MITVAELAAVPHLDLRWHAGRAGGGHRVEWAHSSDLPAPWDWLGAGELLCCNGTGLPADGEGQAAFLAQLHAAGVVGLVLGDGLDGPDLRPELAASAEALAMPVLRTSFRVRFSDISRTVAAAGEREDQARLVEAARVYDVARAAAHDGTSGTRLVERLAGALGCALHVVDVRSGATVLPDAPLPPDGLAAALAAVLDGRREGIPSYVRLALAGTAVAVEVVAAEPAALVALAGAGDDLPRLSTLQHAAALVALELERVRGEQSRGRRRGARILRELREGALDEGLAAAHLEELGVGGGPLCALAPAPDADLGALERALVPFVADAVDGRLGVLLADRHAERATAALAPSAVGRSQPLRGLRAVRDALGEAAWALAATQRPDVGRVARYGDDAPLFLPRSVGEARRAVELVLGPLLDYDATSRAELLRSLRAFLDADRSWQRAAAQLGVHKQTLVYRLRRVEELTGRRLERTADLAELWLAVTSLEAVGRGEPAPQAG